MPEKLHEPAKCLNDTIYFRLYQDSDEDNRYIRLRSGSQEGSEEDSEEGIGGHGG